MTDALQTWTRGRTRVVAAAWAWLAVATYFASDALPGGVFGFCTLVLVGFGIGVAWVWRSLLWLGNLWTWRGLIVWLTVPAVPVVAVYGARTAWPMTVRVWLCEVALREHVAAVQAEGDHGPGRVGLFDTLSSTAETNGAVVVNTTLNFLDVGGILYAPGVNPAEWRYNHGGELRHLYGPWYRLEMRD